MDVADPFVEEIETYFRALNLDTIELPLSKDEFCAFVQNPDVDRDFSPPDFVEPILKERFKTFSKDIDQFWSVTFQMKRDIDALKANNIPKPLQQSSSLQFKKRSC